MRFNVNIAFVCCLLVQGTHQQCLFSCFGTKEDEFTTDIQQVVFAKLASRFKATESCISEAKVKMKTFKKKSVKKRHAIAVMNLYTQQCKLEPGSTDTFYSVLNRELRSTKPTAFWEPMGHLLNDAIDILGPSQYSYVFRGQAHLNSVPKKDSMFSFNQMTSTSTDAIVCLDYFACSATGVEFFFMISNAIGLDVAAYSAFPTEKEVLLKFTATFKVTHVSSDSAANKKDLNDVLKQLGKKPGNYAPRTFIKLERYDLNIGKRSVGSRTRDGDSGRSRAGSSQRRSSSSSSTTRTQRNRVPIQGGSRRGSFVQMRPCGGPCYFC